MIRFIEIRNEEDVQLLTTEDLPLIVSLDIENEPSLIITSVNNYDNLNSAVQYIYIAEDEGHLFIQPVVIEEDLSDSQKNLSLIFHNDEIIKKSIWIKSGDILRIENKIIAFKVSGDRIEILSPPRTDDRNEEIIEKKVTHDLPDVSKIKEHDEQQTTGKIKKNVVISMLIVLMIMAGFILFSETVSITIIPEADNIKLNGSVPSVKLGDRYIAFSGSYQINATKTGYQPLNETIDLNSENNIFKLQMKETPGVVKFNITPNKNNQIFLDNILLGNGLNIEKKSIKYEIEKGQYNLKIINPRYKIYEQLIKIEGKSVFQEFNPVLKPNWGLVVINSNPDNALIHVPSKETENQLLTPAEIELIAGDYDLTISKESYKSKKVKVTIKSDEKAILDLIDLEPLDAEINLKSNPAGGLIQVDGQYYGKTPVTLQLSPFVKHEIEVSLTGYHNKKESFEFSAEEIKTLNFNLKEKKGTLFISTSPAQAKLYINGKLQKKSSGKFIINGNNIDLIVKAKGYKTQTKSINASSYTKNLTFILKKISFNHNVTSDVKKKTNKKNKSNYVNSIGLRMKLMQPALFTMGSAKNEIGRRSNEPEHKVKITRPFYISENEISNKQFKLFKSSHNSGVSAGLSLDNNNQPVVNVSWNDAVKFSNWLSKKEGLTPFYEEVNNQMIAVNLKKQINGYRLPFESEWEYAARGNNQLKYPWVGTFPPKTVSGNFADESARAIIPTIIDSYNDNYGVSAPIGSYKKNQQGYYDMGGNVSEWCQDYYVPNSNFYKIVIDPVGPEKGVHKVVRDSSWKDSSITELRLSYRSYSKKAANDIGFRLARYAE